MPGEPEGCSLAIQDFHILKGYAFENSWITNNRTWTDPSTKEKKVGEVLEAFKEFGQEQKRRKLKIVYMYI